MKRQSIENIPRKEPPSEEVVGGEVWRMAAILSLEMEMPSALTM